MPLPSDSSLSLLPHTNPGESGYSQPKQAMIVKMSAETLDALQSYNNEKPLLKFEFGDVPGIHIGNAFFPMKSLKENSPHELYLRTTSAAKQSAPLKHYANVIGKITVERELGDRVTEMLHKTTSDAAKLRDDRKTIFMDTPPPPPSALTSKKKKEKDHASSMFRHALRKTDQQKLNAAMASARVASPAPPPKPKSNDLPLDLQKRLIHFLALSDRTQEAIVRMMSGSDPDASSRSVILAVLEELGEPISQLKRGEDPTTKVWRLKTEAWKDVRPFEWPNLQEKERLSLSRTGRQKLDSLRIPTSDPIWQHFNFRPQAQNASAGPSSLSKVPEVKADNAITSKHGVLSKDVKEKKVKPKPGLNTEMHVKDESSKPAASSNKKREPELYPSPLAKPSASGRRLPGSGFKMGKTPPTGRDSSNSPSIPTRPLDMRAPSDAQLPLKFQASASHHKSQDKVAPPQRVRKVKESGIGPTSTDSERERLSDRPKEKGKAKVSRDSIEEQRTEMKDTISQKRKQVYDDGDYNASTSKSAPPKKRKTEAGSAPVAQLNKDARLKDPSLLKRPDSGPLARTKVLRDASPLPPPSLPKIKKESPAHTKIAPHEARDEPSSHRGRNEVSSSKANGTSSKLRRKSPVYTSSEDESENRPHERESPSASLPTPSSSNGNSTSSQSRNHRHTHLPRDPRPLPTDHNALRARYKATYGEYLAVYQKMWTQRGKIQNMLDRGDGYGSAAESDLDVMDSESLSRLGADYQRLHEELAAMRAKFEQ